MSKQTRKSQAQQQTLPFSGWEASNMASGTSPLTLETLIIELEKSRKMELRSKLTSITEENGALQAAVEDLVSRSKRQNLRVIGLPEDIEGNNPRQFMADLFQEVAAEALSNSTPELDRDHRSLRPKPRQRSRSVIVRFHRYIDKERVLLWGKEHRNMTYQGHNIKFYEDFSGAVAKRRAAFNQVKSLLFKKGIRFGMIYPARLRVTFDGNTLLIPGHVCIKIHHCLYFV
uniref:Transposase element L1Md-A101/L1Md-A102/L1Md-A2 n=1 Tax=Scophthalmus maximus TaxID=52904 RepID=A0A8D3DRH2_SCOMX